MYAISYAPYRLIPFLYSLDFELNLIFSEVSGVDARMQTVLIGNRYLVKQDRPVLVTKSLPYPAILKQLFFGLTTHLSASEKLGLNHAVKQMLGSSPKSAVNYLS